MSEVDMDPAVGSRLLVGKHGATIRYVGTVEGQDGLWVGLEWDDPTRGKHDGNHSGTRYFSCLKHTQPGATAGSFVRLPKLIATADLGQTLENAIQSRYKIQTDEHNNIIDDPEVDSEAYVPTASNRRVQIRLVGAAAMAALVSQDGALEHASFIGQRISKLIITPNMGVPFFKNVATLDLSNNLIGSWRAVTELLSLLPKLHTLNLSGNLLDIDSINTGSIVQLHSLRTLVLNNCGVTWSQIVLSLAPCVPQLTALHLCRNNISKLKLDCDLISQGVVENSKEESTESVSVLLARQFAKLETLDLEENYLSNWNELSSQLQALPSLKSLLLSGNSFKEIIYVYKTDSTSSISIDGYNIINTSATTTAAIGATPPAPSSGGFTCLEHLMIGSNQLHSWCVADELDKFPSLIDLRISNNPLTTASATTTVTAATMATSIAASALPIRYELIARISKLQMLNGSDIRVGERQDAELAYLRLITDELARAQAQEGAEKLSEGKTEFFIRERHPKFSLLVSKYGELTASGRASTQGTTLSSSMVELIFISGAKQVKKKVPMTLTIGRLKPLLERILKIKLGHQCISLVDPLQIAEGGYTSEDVTSQDGKELGFYGVSNGWRVEVGKRDGVAVSAAKDALLVEHEKRMEEHERGLQRLRAEEERLMVG